MIPAEDAPIELVLAALDAKNWKALFALFREYAFSSELYLLAAEEVEKWGKNYHWKSEEGEFAEQYALELRAKAANV